MTKENLPEITHNAFYMGCDPEFFFKSEKNKIIGAEHIIPEKGLLMDVKSLNDRCVHPNAPTSKFIIDGVQAELNPRPNTCRANLANEIAACFKSLKKALDTRKDGIEVDWSQSIEIEEKELTKLKKESQKFGCMPSLNSHKDTSAKLTEVDPLKYRNRSAGGHIHIGSEGHNNIKDMIAKAPERIVNMLDIICGNTCVLMDRDPGNAVRRKLYGRAGEYRLPKHGLEYRVLSNFWLQAYPLFSMAFGLARSAVNLACDSQHADKFYAAFTGAVEMKDVMEAINTNDFDLAYSNFKKIEPLYMEVIGNSYGTHAFGKNHQEEFHYFVNTVNKNGLSHWFNFDPMTHWTTLPEAHPDGANFFLENTVRNEMRKQKDLRNGSVTGVKKAG